ncbi:hypothetical protein QCA50_003447 [Cerrena zonata]|uniref:Uncharacterized protein n=1 Tax=Cerrena zonata TaxID=2478898 RepID=A0AAW0GS58_9APHY
MYSFYHPDMPRGRPRRKSDPYPPCPPGMDPADHLRQQLEAVGLDCSPIKKKKKKGDKKSKPKPSSSSKDNDAATTTNEPETKPAPKKPLKLGYHPVLPKSGLIKKSWNYQRPYRAPITANDVRRIYRERELQTPKANPNQRLTQPTTSTPTPRLRRSDSQEFRDWQNQYRTIPDSAIIPEPWAVQRCADPRTCRNPNCTDPRH